MSKISKASFTSFGGAKPMHRKYTDTIAEAPSTCDATYT
jgi:hypothetical protein